MLDEWPISCICLFPWTMATAEVFKTECLTFIQLKLDEINPTTGVCIGLIVLTEIVLLFLCLFYLVSGNYI